MRADARKNYDHLLDVARAAICEHGAETSLREIARRAEVGLATLYRHFPTREALLDTLLRTNLDELTNRAGELQISSDPAMALASWFRDGLAFTRTYSDVVALMAAALQDPTSALHGSCSKVRSAGARLLERAQAEGSAPRDMDGTDLFALMGALAWVGDQSAFASRADKLANILMNGILVSRQRGMQSHDPSYDERSNGEIGVSDESLNEGRLTQALRPERYDGEEAERIKKLEDENSNLRRLVIELSLQKHNLNDRRA